MKNDITRKMGKDNTLIFLIQSFEQPRILKIIVDKSKVFDKVFVYGYGRKIHSVKNYTLLDNFENITYKNLGTLEDGKYWSRFFHYLKLLRIIYKYHGLTKKKLYVVGLDLRLLTLFIYNKYVEYVISDLVWLYYPKPFNHILGFVDKMLAKTSDKVLMTSEGFYETYYKNHVKTENFVLTENKLATYGKVFPLQNIKTDRIRIAYIGAFRYNGIIGNLLNVVKNKPGISLNFYGDGTSTIVERMKMHAKNFDNINFHGSFKNPDDLQRIYEENNINFVVYNNKHENERVAMPNKFYESGYFNIPILCATNTYVGKRVLELGMGWTCDIDEVSINDFFKNITIDEIVLCQERIKQLDKSKFNY